MVRLPVRHPAARSKSTTYVIVKVICKSRVVLGEKANMTTVKDVLETGDIVLDPETA